MQVAAMLHHVVTKHGDLIKSVITHKQHRVLAAFLQQPADYIDAEPTFKQSYAPASGEILGILKQMMEEFESNLDQMQKDELAAQKTYEAMKAALEGELKAAQASLDKKTMELGNVD